MSDERMQTVFRKLEQAEALLSSIDAKKITDERESLDLRIASDKRWARIEKNVAEISEKLNPLIGPAWPKS